MSTEMAADPLGITETPQSRSSLALLWEVSFRRDVTRACECDSGGENPAWAQLAVQPMKATETSDELFFTCPAEQKETHRIQSHMWHPSVQRTRYICVGYSLNTREHV